MKQPLLKLRKRYCAETLAAEVRDLPTSAWVPHPGNYLGNDAVLLITANGQRSNAFDGPMMPTEYLRRCRYIMEIMSDIGAVWGRSRLMGLAPGAQVPAHVDVNYYWRTHMRIHIPVITNSGVTFTVGDKSVHMEPGSCWVFDSFKLHDVQNRGSEKRIHLVLDTVGGDAIWDLVEEAEAAGPDLAEPAILAPGSRPIDDLAFEQFNLPGVMTPWEIRCHSSFIADHMSKSPEAEAMSRKLEKFAYAWTAAWARFGPSMQGIPSYQQLLKRLEQDVSGAELKLSNSVPVAKAVEELILKVALPRTSGQPAPAVRSVFSATRAGFGVAGLR